MTTVECNVCGQQRAQSLCPDTDRFNETEPGWVRVLIGEDGSFSRFEVCSVACLSKVETDPDTEITIAADQKTMAGMLRTLRAGLLSENTPTE